MKQNPQGKPEAQLAVRCSAWLDGKIVMTVIALLDDRPGLQQQLCAPTRNLWLASQPRRDNRSTPLWPHQPMKRETQSACRAWMALQVKADTTRKRHPATRQQNAPARYRGDAVKTANQAACRKQRHAQHQETSVLRD